MRILKKWEIDQLLDDAWLKIKVDEEKLFNPLAVIPDEMADNPAKYLFWLMSRPEYISFFCSEMLNINLIPIQSAVLQELWIRKFPMFIGHRGFGKCRAGLYIQLEDKFLKLENVLSNEKPLEKKYFDNWYVRGLNGYKKVEYGWNNGKTDTLTLITEAGFEIICTYNHPLKLVRDGEIKWINAEDIKIGDYIPIVRDDDWILETNNIEPDLAYFFGCLIGDGGYTVRGRIGFTSENSELINKFNPIVKKYFNKEFKKDKSKYGYYFHGVEHWDRLFQEFGFNSSVCSEKDFPSCILSAPKESVAAFIRGLFDTDGYVAKNKKWLEYCSKSKELVRSLQFFLTKFGIISRLRKKYNKKYDQHYYHLYIFGNDVNLFHKKIGFGLQRKQERLEEVIKIQTNSNKDIIPRELLHEIPDVLYNNKQNCTYNSVQKYYKQNKELIDKNYYYDRIKSISSGQHVTYDIHIPDDHSFYDGGFISHNSFLLAIHVLRRMMFMPGRKVVIAGAAFRQAKIIFEYIERIWDNAPLLRDLASTGKNFSHSTDMWQFELGQSICKALPTGDGCLSTSNLITYKNGFGTIQDSVTENIITPINKYIWGNQNFNFSDEAYNNGFKSTLKITTKKGYTIEGTLNHKLKILRDNNVIWERLDKIQVGDKALIDSSYRWHDGNFNCTIEQAYALGLMIGDGSYFDKYYLQFTTKDLELLESVNKGTGYIFGGNDGVHYKAYGKDKVSNWLSFWNMSKNHTLNKILPSNILKSSREYMSACLRGLFDSDGTVRANTGKGGIAGEISLCNTSEKLIRQVQYILLHYGIICRVSNRNRNHKWNRAYELTLNGINVEKFYRYIGFSLKRKQEILQYIIDNKQRWGSQEQYYNDIFVDEIKQIESSEDYTFDIHIPDIHEYCANGFYSHNSKIRGQRANDIICDEFASINKDIFETVIAGFGAVSSNPIDNIKYHARKEILEKFNMEEEIMHRDHITNVENQVVISGTAYYSFNHFHDYWKMWKDIILSKGDMSILRDKYGDDKFKDTFNWKDYSIIRIPYGLLPKGFMDDGQVTRAKATIHDGTYKMEYAAVFATDSIGFFKRSLIEKASLSNKNKIVLPSGEVFFEPKLIGNPYSKYVFGIDPASEVDNFSIVVLECLPDHRRIVYCWTTNKKTHRERLKLNLTDQNDFYAFCARKIRDLMKVFPCSRIALDMQGGGYAVMESLNSTGKLHENEINIWPLIDDDKEKDTDGNPGLHIIDCIQFSNSTWVSEANHNLKMDFQNQQLIFPFIDSISGMIASTNEIGNLYDSLEDCIVEIEEMKNELCSIVHTNTGVTGRDRWDTPEVKMEGQKKGRQKKDRYSSLLMANMSGRQLMINSNYYTALSEGGWAVKSVSPQKNSSEVDFIGPAWFTDAIKGVY